MFDIVWMLVGFVAGMIVTCVFVDEIYFIYICK